MMTMYTSKTIVPFEENDQKIKVIQLSLDELRDTFELDSCVQWITKHDVKKVCLQFPDGLLYMSVDIALYLEAKLGFRLYILGDGTYGSCCVDEIAAQHIGADGIIHFGHYCLSPAVRLPVLYIFEKKPIDITSFINSFKRLFGDSSSRILLLYDVGYKHALPSIVSQLSEIYCHLTVSKLMIDDADQKEKHSILGRTINLEDCARIEDYQVVFIGPEGRSLEILVYALPACRFYIFDPVLHKTIEDYMHDKRKFHRKRMYLIEKIKQAKTLGILIGTLTVASYGDAIERIKALAKRAGKKTYIIAVGKPNVPKLANFPEIEVYVLVACPESSLLDTKEFFQSIVTMHEVELALNPEHEWSEKHITDFRTLLPGGSDYVPEKDVSEDECCNISHVSLIDGQLHHFKHSSDEPENDEQSTIVSLRGDTTVSTYTGFSLTSRSWKGLEQKLGETEVKLAVPGRQGIAQKYTHEPYTDEENS